MHGEFGEPWCKVSITKENVTIILVSMADTKKVPSLLSHSLQTSRRSKTNVSEHSCQSQKYIQAKLNHRSNSLNESVCKKPPVARFKYFNIHSSFTVSNYASQKWKQIFHPQNINTHKGHKQFSNVIFQKVARKSAACKSAHFFVLNDNTHNILEF